MLPGAAQREEKVSWALKHGFNTLESYSETKRAKAHSVVSSFGSSLNFVPEALKEIQQETTRLSYSKVTGHSVVWLELETDRRQIPSSLMSKSVFVHDIFQV